VSPDKPDILIIGAGPVGLTAAIELTRRGFHPRIVEKDTGRHVESRALAVNPRSLDILEASGASERLLKAGLKVRAMNFHGPDKVLFQLDMRNIPHPTRKYMLVLPQAETEKHLIATLGGASKVDWGTEATGLELKDGKPTLTLLRNGVHEKVRPDFVIGADGAHSPTRKALGIDFIGAAYEHDWGLADVRLDGLPCEELHVFDLSPLLMAFFPIRGDLFRVVADTANVFDRLPSQIRVKKIVWESRFRISHRQVETYQKGPVFLAGDAAHIHSPVGGRGMNLGIEDAAWLAWLIERGDTVRYTELRHPIAKQVLVQVDRVTRLVSSDGAAATFLRRKVLPFIARRNFIQRNVFKTITGLSTPAPPWLP